MGHLRRSRLLVGVLSLTLLATLRVGAASPVAQPSPAERYQANEAQAEDPAAFACSAAVPGNDQAPTSGPDDVPDGMWYDPSTAQLRDDALAVDAACLAERSGMDIDRALVSLQAQQSMDSLLAEVQAQYPDVFVGVYWDEDLRAVAQFIDRVPEDAVRILETSGVEVTAELAKYSGSGLDSLMDDVISSLDASGAPDFSVAVDPRSQTVFVTIGATAGDPSPTTIASQLRAQYRESPVAIDVVAGPAMKPWAAYGGGRVYNSTLSCTAGFTVVKAGTGNGIATAGHCGSPLTTYRDEFTGLVHQLTFKAKHTGGYGDFEWFMTNGTEYDDFYLTSGTLRDVCCVKSSFSRGNVLYWWGWATWPTTWTSTVEYTRVYAGGIDNLVCMLGVGGDQGDSGGPVYTGNTAAGFTFGAVYLNGAWRSCFSQARYIDEALLAYLMQ
jgi:hypothetical protein